MIHILFGMKYDQDGFSIVDKEKKLNINLPGNPTKSHIFHPTIVFKMIYEDYKQHKDKIQAKRDRLMDREDRRKDRSTKKPD